MEGKEGINVKTITEISKYKFLEMVAFCNAYKKVYGEMPESEKIQKQFGEVKGKLFANMLVAFDLGTLKIDTFIRATLRDDNQIEYKHYHK